MTEQEQTRSIDLETPAAPEQPVQDSTVLPEEPIQPEVEAARFIHLGLPMARTQIDKVTGNQAKRVLIALLESPLEKTVEKFTTQEAADLFRLGVMIQNAKHVLFQVALNNQSIVNEVEQKIADGNLETEVKQEENTNG